MIRYASQPLIRTLLILTPLPILVGQNAVPLQRADAKMFGAKGDGTTDDQAAIVRAIQFLKAKRGGTLFFPAGTYLHSDLVLLGSNMTVEGAPDHTSVLKATTANRAALVFEKAQNCGVQDLEVKGASSRRLQSYTSVDILLTGDSHCTVQHVALEGSASAGMMIAGSTDIQIMDNTIADTMADGIHVVAGSRNVTVARNTASNTGDDSFAAVAYASDPPTSDITIRDNTSRNSKARGAACIGAVNCLIEGNTIIQPKSHGIAIASEKVYKTDQPAGARVINNTIEGADTPGQQSILVEGAKTIRLEGNHITGSNAVYVLDSQGVVITGSNIRDGKAAAVFVRSSEDVQVLDSHVTGTRGSGILFESVSGGRVANNHLENVKNGDTSVFADVDISKSTGISGEGNTSTHPSHTSSKALRVVNSDSTVKVALQ